jgi:hypothetical protein
MATGERSEAPTRGKRRVGYGGPIVRFPVAAHGAGSIYR